MRNCRYFCSVFILLLTLCPNVGTAQGVVDFDKMEVKKRAKNVVKYYKENSVKELETWLENRKLLLKSNFQFDPLTGETKQTVIQTAQELEVALHLKKSSGRAGDYHPYGLRQSLLVSLHNAAYDEINGPVVTPVRAPDDGKNNAGIARPVVDVSSHEMKCQLWLDQVREMSPNGYLKLEHCDSRAFLNSVYHKCSWVSKTHYPGARDDGGRDFVRYCNEERRNPALKTAGVPNQVILNNELTPGYDIASTRVVISLYGTRPPDIQLSVSSTDPRVLWGLYTSCVESCYLSKKDRHGKTVAPKACEPFAEMLFKEITVGIILNKLPGAHAAKDVLEAANGIHFIVHGLKDAQSCKKCFDVCDGWLDPLRKAKGSSKAGGIHERFRPAVQNGGQHACLEPDRSEGLSNTILRTLSSVFSRWVEEPVGSIDPAPCENINASENTGPETAGVPPETSAPLRTKGPRKVRK